MGSAHALKLFRKQIIRILIGLKWLRFVFADGSFVKTVVNKILLSSYQQLCTAAEREVLFDVAISTAHVPLFPLQT
jgi:hypothetical protein